MALSIRAYREMEKLPPDIKGVLLAIFEEMDNSVKKDDFYELKSVVAQLAEAQKRTEERVSELAEVQKRTEERVNELAEAQKRTEERLNELAEAQKRTEERVNELAEAQKRTEERLNELAEAQKRTEERLNELAEAQKRTEERVNELAEAQKRTEERVNELAEAQKRTEERLNELAEAQKRTEERVNELAEAQKRTEESLNKLIKRVDNIEEQLGGLSMAVGYGIEDKLYPYIDRFIKSVFHVEPQETLLRYHIEYEIDKFDEINLYTECMSNDDQCLVIGECKAQISKKDVDRFMKLCKRVSDFTGKIVYKYIIGYTFSPQVEKYIKDNYPELKYYKTYQIEHGKY